MPIQRMHTTTPPWQILTELRWLLVEAVQISKRLKSWIFQVTPGPKLLTILIMISKFSIFLKLTSQFWDFKLYFSYYAYATVSTPKGAIFIGGYDGSQISTVACYNNSGWSKLDDLQSIRYAPRAIINGDKVYVVGGDGVKWVLNLKSIVSFEF